MKIQNAEARTQKTEALRKYRDSHNAGHSIFLRHIGMSRDDAKASRRFFNQHKHVLMDEAGGALLNALGSLSLVAFMVAVTVFAARTASRFAATNERIDHLQFEVLTLTHTVGELNRDLLCATNATLTSGGSR